MPAWLTHNLSGLLRFSGRTPLRLFWPYTGVVFVVTMGVGLLAMQWAMSDFLGHAQRIAVEHPEMVDETIGPGSYSVQVRGFHPEFATAFAKAAIAMGAVAVVFILLVAAAVARRLHDRDKAGWWGGLPLPFLAFGLIAMTYMFATVSRSHEPNLTLFFAIVVNNMIYLASLLFVVVMLAGPGTSGSNRYGDPPA